jgi:AhpD family alkylhydroperoxidase
MERIIQRDLPHGLMQSLFQVQQYVDQSGIDKRLLALIRMRVSQINSCAYCIDMHFKEGVEEGETPLRLISVSAWRETPYYSPEEQAVLAFAEILTHMPSEASSEEIHKDLDRYFDKAQIANLTLAIVMINSWNRVTRSFGTTPGNYKAKSSKEVKEAITQS